MKTKVLKLLSVLCLILIFLFGCAEVDSMNYKSLADTINDASDFGEYRLLDNYPGTPENYDPEHPETTQRLGQDGKMELEGTYFYFPNDNGSICLSFILILSDKYHLFGVHLGDSLAQAEDVFLEYGFTEDIGLKEKYHSKYYYYRNGWGGITLKTDDSAEQLLTLIQVGFVDPTARDYVL